MVGNARLLRSSDIHKKNEMNAFFANSASWRIVQTHHVYSQIASSCHTPSAHKWSHKHWWYTGSWPNTDKNRLTFFSSITSLLINRSGLNSAQRSSWHSVESEYHQLPPVQKKLWKLHARKLPIRSCLFIFQLSSPTTVQLHCLRARKKSVLSFSVILPFDVERNKTNETVINEGMIQLEPIILKLMDGPKAEHTKYVSLQRIHNIRWTYNMRCGVVTIRSLAHLILNIHQSLEALWLCHGAQAYPSLAIRMALTSLAQWSHPIYRLCDGHNYGRQAKRNGELRLPLFGIVAIHSIRHKLYLRHFIWFQTSTLWCLRIFHLADAVSSFWVQFFFIYCHNYMSFKRTAGARQCWYPVNAR